MALTSKPSDGMKPLTLHRGTEKKKHVKAYTAYFKQRYPIKSLQAANWNAMVSQIPNMKFSRCVG